MPWYYDLNGLPYFIDDNTGQVITPVGTPTEPPATQPPPSQTQQTQTTNPSQPQPPPQSPYAAPPPGHYISGYVNGQPVYSPIGGTTPEQPVITPSSPDYPTQPVITPPPVVPPPETVYYEDKDEWEAAGSPTSDETKDVIIGTPPKPGEPTTGVFVKDENTGETKVVPFSEYKPELAPGYVPTVQGVELSAIKQEEKVKQFEDKWADKLQDDKFVGTEQEYEQYISEYQSLVDSGEILQGQIAKLEENRISTIKSMTTQDLAALIRSGNIDNIYEWVNEGLITSEQLLDAQIADSDNELKRQSYEKLKKYITDDGSFKLLDALKDKVDASTIRNLGIDLTQDDYNKAISALSEVDKPIIDTKPAYEKTTEVIAKEYQAAEDALTNLMDRIDSEHPDMSPEDKEKLIKSSDEYKRYNDSVIASENHKSTFSDIVSETLSLGKIPTASFNKDKLSKQYDQQVAISVATFKGDKAELKRLYDEGYFGEVGKKESMEALAESFTIINQQDQIEQAVKNGDVAKLDQLFQEGAFGNNKEDYVSLVEYVKSGGRELETPTEDDMKAVVDSLGTRDQYIQNILDSQPKNIDLAGEVLIAMIPIYGTIHTWDESNNVWRAVSIATDVLTFVPLVGAVAAASKVAAGLGRGARIAAGMKAIPKIALAEAKAPFTALMHPLNTAKATFKEVRNLGEWLLNPKQIPINAATTTHGTVRLDASVAGSPEAAMLIRDKLMELQAAGKKPVLIFGDKVYSLREPSLMKGGGLATASPDIKWVETDSGAVVKSKVYPEGHSKAGQRMPESEQGLFTANTLLERFTESSAFGLENVGKTFDDKLKLMTEAAANARNQNNIKLADRLDNLIRDGQKASVSGDKLQIESVSQKIDNELTTLAKEETLENIYQLKVTANERYRIGDIEGAQDAMLEADALQKSLEPSKPGFAVFSTDVSIYTVPSNKLYKGMVFQPSFNEFWTLASNDIKQDKAAQLFLEADNAKKAGDIAKASELNAKASELVKSGNSGFVRIDTVEMERKFPEFFQLPHMKERYFTRHGATGQRLSIFTDKPYDFKTVIKAKMLAPIDTVKQIFSPAIKANTIPMTDVQKLTKIDDLIKEADSLESTGDLITARAKRIEAESLRVGLLTPGESIKGQTLVNKISEIYGLNSKPINKASLWTRFKNELNNLLRRPTIDMYVNDEGIFTLTEMDDAKVVLHELAHGSVDAGIDKTVVNKLSKLRGVDNRIVLENGLLMFSGDDKISQSIVEGFKELSTIEYVKRISGWDDLDYLSILKERLGDDLYKSINDIAKEYIDRLNPKFIRQIPDYLIGESIVREAGTSIPINTISKAIDKTVDIDEADEYIQAAQKAESLGDTVSADRLYAEADRIRRERISSLRYLDEVSRQTGTAIGMSQIPRVLGYRTPTYQVMDDIRSISTKVYGNNEIPDLRSDRVQFDTDYKRAIASPLSDTRYKESIVTEPDTTGYMKIDENKIEDEGDITDQSNVEYSDISERFPDNRLPDTRMPDIRVPETRIPDARIIETRIPDTRVIEPRIPDTRIPDTRLPDTRVPDVRLPDTRIPDTRIPVIRTPEIRTPEIRTPDTKTPEFRIISTELKHPEISSNDGDDKKVPSINSPITWKQGFVYWTIFPPKNGWNDEIGEPTVKCTRYIPQGAYYTEGVGSAYRTIKALGGNADVILGIDMGIMDVTIEKPSTAAGKKGSIRFKQDKNQMTINKLTVKGVKRSD